MQLSVQCSEEIAFTSFEEIAAAGEAYPVIVDFLVGPRVTEVCEKWLGGELDVNPVEDEPVISDIPTLVLAGEYDPVTRPEWGRMVSEDLSNSFFYEFPGIGHGASFGVDCSTNIALEFLDDPLQEPDSTCIADMTGPKFVVPETEITLVPYTSEILGISGVVPEGWNEIQPGIYTQTGLGDVLIIQQVNPVNVPGDVIEAIATQLGLAEVPEAVGTHPTESFTWSLYELEVLSLFLDIALTEHNGGTIFVMLQGNEAGREFLKEEVFLPAIDALKAVNGG